jgi:hypothetical protein
MREVKRQGKRYIQMDGYPDFEYDGVVKIYVDSATGNWVVHTNLQAESVIEVLSDAQDHFASIIEDEANGAEPADGEQALPSVYPLKDSDYNN